MLASISISHITSLDEKVDSAMLETAADTTSAVRLEFGASSKEYLAAAAQAQKVHVLLVTRKTRLSASAGREARLIVISRIALILGTLVACVRSALPGSPTAVKIQDVQAEIEPPAEDGGVVAVRYGMGTRVAFPGQVVREVQDIFTKGAAHLLVLANFLSGGSEGSDADQNSFASEYYDAQATNFPFQSFGTTLTKGTGNVQHLIISDKSFFAVANDHSGSNTMAGTLLVVSALLCCWAWTLVAAWIPQMKSLCFFRSCPSRQLRSMEGEEMRKEKRGVAGAAALLLGGGRWVLFLSLLSGMDATSPVPDVPASQVWNDRSSGFRKVVDDWLNVATRSGVVATYGEIEEWDTSGVTSMNNLFRSKTSFNADLSKWDTSQVTTMEYSTCSSLPFLAPFVTLFDLFFLK
jgi:surface protein